MKNCLDCVHFSRDSNGGDVGECRHKSPRLAPEGSEYAIRDAGPWAYWPVVRGGMWCSDFRAKQRAKR